MDFFNDNVRISLTIVDIFPQFIFPYHKKVTVYITMSYPSLPCWRTFDLWSTYLLTPNMTDRDHPMMSARLARQPHLACVCEGDVAVESAVKWEARSVFIMFSTYAVSTHRTASLTFLWCGKNEWDTCKCLVYGYISPMDTSPMWIDGLSLSPTVQLWSRLYRQVLQSCFQSALSLKWMFLIILGFTPFQNKASTYPLLRFLNFTCATD